MRPFWLGLQYDESLRDNTWLEDGTAVTFNKFKSGISINISSLKQYDIQKVDLVY